MMVPSHNLYVLVPDASKWILMALDPQPEYTYATSCDFCGHGDHNRTTNWWPADKPPSYSPAGMNEVFRPDVMKTIEETLIVSSSELRELSLRIHGELSHDGYVPALNPSWCCVGHPELGFQEKSVV